MKRNLVYVLALAFFIASCGDSKKDEAGSLNDKKVKLEKLKKEQADLGIQIDSLQNQIARLDPNASSEAKAKLVAFQTIEPTSFTHYIDLQGKIDATNIAYVAPPNGTGGVVTALYVKEGQAVHKGQVLVKLDDQLLRQQIAPLQVNLSSAEDTYKRTKNLWDQGIGTYQSVLTAKTQVENLEKQIDIIKKQISLTTVTAPISGVADVVGSKVGQMFSPTDIRIVNTGSLKVTVNVPENYIGKVGVGSIIRVTLPDDTSRVWTIKVNAVGKTIDPISRSFYVEAPIPSSPNFKPNQVVVAKLQDYALANAITAPLNTLQNDEKGKYILVAVKENGKLIARKKYVTVGELYGDRIEIKAGLSAGDQIITEGFQGLYDGQLITTS